ncbi:Rho GTPase-activating protein 22 [Mortierella sp. NVP85]|nr:Rho GTPase-activating protein 22 [Mortierella sp. NVP85]
MPNPKPDERRLFPTSLKGLPRPISIRHSQSYEPPPLTPTSLPLTAELKTKRSSASLNFLASVKPLDSTNKPHDPEHRSRNLPFANPFKKLQNTFGGNHKRIDLPAKTDDADLNDKVQSGRAVSSSSSANSLTSWRSKGAEILSKSLGRNRKNSEPVLKGATGAGSAAGNAIFGADLEDAIRLSHIPNTPMVPAVLYRCAEFLEAKGVDEVGLYRVPGSHANVQKLKQMFDTGKDYDLLTIGTFDPNDIATLLKLYLRELPRPLIPGALLEQFQSSLTSDRQISQTLREILARLPRSNYDVLSYICHHLSKIAAHSEKTKMTVTNLALVFAPTLAIGHILFQALLSAFCDGIEKPEKSEMGLQAVWSEQLQIPGDSAPGWLKVEADTPRATRAFEECNVSPYQDQEYHLSHHQHSILGPSPINEQGTHNNSVMTLAPPSYRGIGPLDLDHCRNDQLPVGPLSPSALSSDGLGETGVSEEVRLMNALLQCENSDPAAISTLGSENPEKTVESEERRLMDAMLQREDDEPISTTLSISSDCLEREDDEESRLIYEMLQREEMAVKSGPSSSPSPSPMGAPNPPTHLTSTAIIPGYIAATPTASSFHNKITKTAELSIPSPSVDVSILPKGPHVSNITIKAGTMPPSPTATSCGSPKEPLSTIPGAIVSGMKTDASPILQQPLPSKGIPGTFSPFEGVSISV